MMRQQLAPVTGLHAYTVAHRRSKKPVQAEACHLKLCSCSCPAGHLRPTGMQQSLMLPSSGAQMDFLSAAVQNAFTTVFAGFAFTTTVFPNISLLPALAGFRRVLIMQRPGMTKLPA